MNLKKIKEILKGKDINFKDKKVQAISGVVAGALIIAVAGTMILHNKSIENNNVAIEKNIEDKTSEDDVLEEINEELEAENTVESEEVVESTEEHVYDENCNHSTEELTETASSTTADNKAASTESNTNQETTTSNKKTSSSSSNNTNTSNGSIHTHNWKPITDQVYHDEVGHWEDVVVTPAWTENVPVYEERELSICNGCGKDITNDPWGHIEEQMLQGNTSCGGYHSQWKQVQVGTNAVNHPAVTEKKWVVDKAAWTETVTTGYSCSCGATK